MPIQWVNAQTGSVIRTEDSPNIKAALMRGADVLLYIDDPPSSYTDQAKAKKKATPKKPKAEPEPEPEPEKAEPDG